MNTYHLVRRSLLLITALTLVVGAWGAPAAHTATTRPFDYATTRVQPDWGKMPLYFIANQGQMDDRVAYYVQGSDKTLYFASEGVTFALTQKVSADARSRRFSAQEAYSSAPNESSRWIVKLDFVDANAVRPSGQAQTEAVISYFKGSRDEWRTGLPTYSQIVYPDLWEGIDLVYSGTVNRLKYEFVVKPGADPAAIRLAYRGATVRVNDAGQLEVSTPAGGFQDDAPVAYQEVAGQRVPVAVAYALEDAARWGADEVGTDEPRPYGFHVGAYNPALPLVIDPTVLVYCGYIGGGGDDYGYGIAVDAAGNAYVTGDTASTEATFPETVGPDVTHNDGEDAFVAKVNASGSALVYAGYIGGSADDRGFGIAVDSAGNAYVTGDTNSTQATFPVTVGPDLTYNGGPWDAFVAKVRVRGEGECQWHGVGVCGLHRRQQL
ncbi:MAG: SBBP repeat-containing protein [Chloroflexi bacterium]|nr:SBBP repeat-containing protein [Chloroflexota bacterium]